MNKKIFAIMTAIGLIFVLNGCVQTDPLTVDTPDMAVEMLMQGNEKYIKSNKNSADISKQLRESIAEDGQKPYAVILTCSDSRVPPEHIFSAGLGDLFVIRTAGNVISDFELGSIEYGVEHLGAKAIVVLGHSHCGAVAAALEGHAEGNIISIVEEIQAAIGGITDSSEAEGANISNSFNKILTSEIVKELLYSEEIVVLKSKYDIQTGKVEFLN